MSHGPVEERRPALVKAYDAAKAAGDHDAMAAAALELAGLQIFGSVPGRIPAFLFEAYENSEGRRRVELAIAVARVWAYGGQPTRAVPFVAEALSAAEETADPGLLAQALDAQLLVLWGPDDFEDRLRAADRLEDVVANISDVELQMSAYLWRLTTALERLDVPAMRRQLRGLEQLSLDSGSARVRFFAASRRAMHALLVGDAEEAERAREIAVAAGYEAGEADAYAIDHQLRGTIAIQREDVATMLAEAPHYESFWLSDGVISVGAEAARLLVCSGQTTHAERLLHELAGADFGRIPRDVDWMLSVTALTEVAAALRIKTLCDHAVTLLTPYAGRGVVNGGGVCFVGVVDHYLALACDALGREDDARRWWGSAGEAYRRFGAAWWASRCGRPSNIRQRSEAVLRPAGPGVWDVGWVGSPVVVREMRGLRYLQILLEHPGVDITARELSDLAAGIGAGDAPRSPDLPVLDRTAMAAYRRRLAEIDTELDEADERGDESRAVWLTTERDALLGQVRSATGLGGRVRATGGADERARVAVRKAIAAAIAKINDLELSLGRLLADTVSTGAICRYDPDPDRAVVWRTAMTKM